MTDSIRLFDFQQQAASQMSEAIEEWLQAYAEEGPSYLGKIPVPFVGHLKAVTGAGKTPILSQTVGDLAHAVVLWTSKASAVADQTFKNLTGKYSHLLPANTRVVRERPSKGEWESLIEAERGITIWVTTVGSWNEPEHAEGVGSETARLNMHRPHPDWGGDRSPWDQLRVDLRRPLWVVYDESHNQTPTQLDQLINLRPVGFLLASATPPSGGQFDQFADIVEADPSLRAASEKGHVRVATRDVVEAQLLKHTIDIENFDSDADALLDATIQLHRELTAAAEAEGAPVVPKALYIVEKSNPVKGEVQSRPEVIWEHLRNRGVPADEIAVYTQTRSLPAEAERVGSLSDLLPRYKHIISNRSLQEGWDDPEAYIEYFDDESNSYVRISQVIGRSLRQPRASHFDDDRLNTSTLFVRVPNATFDGIVDGLKAELALYDTDDAHPGSAPAIRIKTRKQPLPEVPVRAEFAHLSLPAFQLGEANLKDEIDLIQIQAKSLFPPEALIANGQKSIQTISLRGLGDTARYELIAASMRRKNGEYLRRRIQVSSRHCAHLLDPVLFTGPAFDQWSCSGSLAQRILAERAARTVSAFESTVDLIPVEIVGEEEWTPAAHRPSTDRFYEFERSIHPKYAQNTFNPEELALARALDAIKVGSWARNPARGDGYGIQLPMKVGTSSTFYPDFIWWIDDRAIAIDPTGRFILQEKVRGKLLSLDFPSVALLTPGRVSADFSGLESEDGYTVVRARKNRSPSPEYVTSLNDALVRVGGLTGPATS